MEPRYFVSRKLEDQCNLSRTIRVRAKRVSKSWAINSLPDDVWRLIDTYNYQSHPFESVSKLFPLYTVVWTSGTHPSMTVQYGDCRHLITRPGIVTYPLPIVRKIIKDLEDIIQYQTCYKLVDRSGVVIRADAWTQFPPIFPYRVVPPPPPESL